MRLDYILKASAMHMLGVFVDVNRSMCHVSIYDGKNESIFLQGDDAEQFIAECDKYSNRCKCLDFSIIELAVAEPYVECIWG